MGKHKQITEPPPVGVVMNLPQPPLPKSEEYLKAYKGYSYTAISSIAQEVASIELMLYKKVIKTVGGKLEVEVEQVMEHPILSFLHYINPLTSFYDFTEATQIYEELVGEAFWVILREQGITGIPTEAWQLRPDWVKVIPSSTKMVEKYVYAPGGGVVKPIDIPVTNMVHFKYFNPLNPYRGRGSIQAAAMPLDIHDFSMQYNRNFFFNNATPGLVFTTDQKLNEAVIKRFVHQWQSTYGGRENAHKVAFLSGGFKADKISQTSKEMDFVEMQRVMRDDILAVFKVPKTVLGLSEDVNRANAEATTMAFMERVITPRMKKFVGHLNEFLLPMFGETGLFLDFVDPAPEDVEQKLKIYENGRKFGWLTANEVREMENMEPIEGGDDLTPVGGAPQLPTPDGEKPADEDAKHFKKMTPDQRKKNVESLKILVGRKKHMIAPPAKRPAELKAEDFQNELKKELVPLLNKLVESRDVLSDEPDPEKEKQRLAVWQKFVDRTEQWEKQMIGMMKKQFKLQEGEIIENLELIKYMTIERRKGKESSILPSITTWVRQWIATLMPFIRTVVSQEGSRVLDDLGVYGSLSLATSRALQFLDRHGLSLVREINNTTRDELREQLTEGLALGEGIDPLRRRVQSVFTRASTTRAEMIARTEIIRATNFASNEAYLQSKGIVVRKEWLAERDERTCPFCLDIDGKTISVEKIFFKKGDTINAKGQSYTVELLDVGYPPLHPGCRCTIIPIVEGT